MKDLAPNDLHFGTDGIREKVGLKTLTLKQLPKLGMALGQWLIHHYGKNCHVLIGHDTRISCGFIKAALESGLLLYPLIIHDGQTLPTPTVCHLVKQSKQLSAGIIITASHNCYQDNGLKIINSNGSKIKKDTVEIEQIFQSSSELSYNYQNLGRLEIYSEALQRYISNICSLFSPEFLTGLTIVFDCAHGAFSTIANDIFNIAGAKIFTINSSPDGKNINKGCGALHTEPLQTAVERYNADIGFACDGDGDRLIAITKDGLKKDGDDILALLSQHPNYEHEAAIVGTIMSNQGFEIWLQERNKQLIRADVGEASVTEKLNENKLLLGGEPSGHIVMSDYLSSSDAIVIALRLLEVIIKTDNWSLQTFKRYPHVNLTIPVKKKIPLTEPRIKNVVSNAQDILAGGRLIIRYSGTESLLRITAEDSNEKKAEKVAHNVAQKMQRELV